MKVVVYNQCHMMKPKLCMQLVVSRNIKKHEGAAKCYLLIKLTDT